MQNFDSRLKLLSLNMGTVSRSALILGCSLICAPLASPAFAVDIDNDTTQPVETGTANSGAADDITVTDDTEIDISGQENTVAVTINSSHDVTLLGSLIAEDTDNTTGIRVVGSQTSNITINGEDGNEGVISLIEDYERTDSDGDGDEDGPLATGTGRTGILVDAGTTMTGNITLETDSSITVEGNNSGGILVGGALDGNFVTDGSVAVTGDNAQGLLFDEGVSGNILISGAVSARGENATAVEVNGDVGGALTIESTVLSTGFVSTTTTNYVSPTNENDDTPPLEERLDSDELLDNTGGVIVSGSVANGILVNGNVDDFISEEDTEDETKDTLDDFDENRSAGSITSFGSGAALRIAAETTGESIVIGPVVETVRDTTDDDEDGNDTETLATFNLDQGLINRGTIASNGLNVGFNAVGLELMGLADGSATVTVQGGLLNSGTISATAFEADGVAIQVGPSVDLGTLENSGTIFSSIATRENNTSTAILIQENATLTTLTNSGTITASSSGFGGQTTAIKDESGTLTTITNTGTIRASLLSDGREDDGTGSSIAVDLSASSADVIFNHFERAPVEDRNGDDAIDEDDTPNPIIAGDVLFGSGNDLFHLEDGAMAGDIDFGTGEATFELVDTALVGDTRFGGSSANLSISAGSTVQGDFAFGSASGTVNIANSIYTGALISDPSAALALTVQNSTASLLSETEVHLQSLDITGESTLGVSVDPQAPRTAPYVTVNGTANIGESAQIEPQLESIVRDGFSVTLVEADTLNFEGSLSDSITGAFPFIYNITLAETSGDTSTLDLNFDLKSADELGLDTNQNNALDAVLELGIDDDEIGAALGSLSDQAEFEQAYDLLLPQRTDASTRYLESQANSSFGALREHLALNRLTPARTSSFWAQQNYTRLEQDNETQSPGYNGRGLGVSAGYDRKLFGLDAVGVMVNLTDGQFEEKTGGTNPVTTTSVGFGGYVAEAFGPLNLQLAAQHALVDFGSTRRVFIGDYFSSVSGTWEGTADSASALATLEFGSGLLRASPRIGYDYISVSQDGYVEQGSNGLNLSVSEAETERTSASAGLELAAVWRRGTGGFQAGEAPVSAFGWSSDVTYRAAIDVGYRTALSSTPYEVTANFVGQDDLFVLTAQDEAEDAVTAGISFLATSDLLSLKFGANAETTDTGLAGTLNVTFRVRF